MTTQANNPFKKIAETEKVPRELREKVMKHVTMLQLFGDMTEQFMERMGKSMKEFLNTNKGSKS